MLRTKHSELLWSMANAPPHQDATREIAKLRNETISERRATPNSPLSALAPGELVTVRTRNSRYRLIVLDRLGRKVLVQGGRHFPCTTEAHMLDGSWVTELLGKGAQVGNGMLFMVGDRGFMTSAIVRIEREGTQVRAA